MAKPTEDTVNDLVRDYLQDHGFSITTQTSAKTTDGRRQPDFELHEHGEFYGEGEWQSSYMKGVTEAIEYGDIGGAAGYFVIGYDDDLQDTIKQKRFGDTAAETLLSGHTFRGLFKVRGSGKPSTFKGPIQDVPGWIEDTLQDEAEEDPEEYIAIMRDLVDGLTQYIPDSQDHPSLFRNIFPDLVEDDGNPAARDAAAYVLLNQIVFYRILEDYGFPSIDESTFNHPAELNRKYFDKLPEGAYDAIFEIDVSSLVDPAGLNHVKDMIRTIDELEPQDFTRDLLGNTFHELIPLDVRKHVAAYYTNPMAARLLANLSVQSDDAHVADLACGSGSLLMGAYERKADLLRGDIDEDVHEEFVNEELTGVDLMPFAAHLAVVQLALRNPGYETNATRIAIEDSTTLNPGDIISPQQQSLRRGQAAITQGWTEEDVADQSVESGAASGHKFQLNRVDTVIMNPPFTRKQKITSDYRSELRKNLSGYLDYIDDEMGYYGYFLPLADKFLKEKDESENYEGGRMAMVIPAVILQQISTEGLRRMLQEKYTLEHIVLTQYRSAFSEDTSYRDILLVARKDPDGDEPCRISSLSVMPENGNLADLVDGLTKDIDGQYENDLLQTVERPQSEFRNDLDWMSVVREHIDVEFFYDYPDDSRLSSFEDQIDSMIGGIRLHDSSDKLHPENSLISKERDAEVHMDWKILDEESMSYTAQSLSIGNEVKIPKSCLDPALRSFSGQRTMEIADPPDYVVIDEFPGDEDFWMDADPDEILSKRQKHIDSRMCQLILGGYGNLDLTAPGTSFLGLASEEPLAPTWTMWAVSVDSWDDARLLALWWNSTYSIAKLITERNEVRGSLVKWRKGDLLELPVMDLDDLTDDEREELLELFDELSDREFPALVHQFEAEFEPRVKIDKKWNEILGWDYDDESLTRLYSQLEAFLKDMKELMDHD